MWKTVPENMYANNVRMQKNIWRAIRISGQGGSSGSSRWREAVQHWLLSSPTSHHVLFAWNNAKKLLIFYWYHNKNIFNFCLKAKKLKYYLVPQWPREVFDWPANFQHFCYTRVGPWNVHGEIWRWNQKCAKLWHLHLPQLLSDSKPSVSTAISLWPWHRYNKRVKGWLQCCTFPPWPSRRCIFPGLKSAVGLWVWSWRDRSGFWLLFENT